MDKALTIIIPAYNVSQYIEQGLDSLISDMNILPLLDIIVVNDGSNDDTLSKTYTYCKRFKESISVIDKANGGHGSVINVGIKAAKGKYIKVLDGDDWVKQEGLKELVEYIKKTESYPDVIINPFEKVWEDGKRETINFEQIEVERSVDYREVIRYGYTLSLHTLTIKREIYQNNNIPEIDTKISYDDMEYMLYPVPYINSIVFLKKIVYEYRLGLPEQSMNPEQMKKKLPMHTKVIESLSNYYCSKQDLFSESQTKYFQQEFVDTLATNIDIRLSVNEPYLSLRKFWEKYTMFPLLKTRKRKMRILLKFKRLGYMIIRVAERIQLFDFIGKRMS